MANFLLFLFIFLTLTIKAETLIGRVFRVADGDTITVLDEAKTQHKIRLDKIDATEKKQAYGIEIEKGVNMCNSRVRYVITSKGRRVLK